MAVSTPAPPSGIEDLARTSLSYLSAHAFGNSEEAVDRLRRSARVADPLRVYYLGLRPVITEPGLSDAEVVAWRFFVMRGNRAVAATEIGVPAEGAPRWSYISYDRRIQTQLAVLKRVRRDPRYRRASYEARFLRVPSLDVNALLWLKPLDSGEDLLIPMGAQSVVRAGWPYSAAKWFALVEGHAQRRLKSSTAPRRSEES